MTDGQSFVPIVYFIPSTTFRKLLENIEGSETITLRLVESGQALLIRS